jgi:DNA-nicking Smr family endonuclease
MATISKDDKRIWENYVSNLEKYILFPKNDGLLKNKIVNNKHIIRNKSSNSVRSLKKKKLEPDTILDLHGQTLYSAKLLLHKFMSNCYEKNIRNILIITGKGQNNKGVLKEEVPKWLNDNLLNKFLVNFNVAPKHFGGEGALLVRLKNRFKTNYQ